MVHEEQRLFRTVYYNNPRLLGYSCDKTINQTIEIFAMLATVAM